jgi:hypothetical protein
MKTIRGRGASRSSVALSITRTFRVIAGADGRKSVGHTSVHSDSGSRAWGSGAYARCVEEQQQRKLHGPPSDRVRAASADLARGAYAAAALARACCGSCGRCEQRSYWYLSYTFGGREAPDWRRC